MDIPVESDFRMLNPYAACYQREKNDTIIRSASEQKWSNKKQKRTWRCTGLSKVDFDEETNGESEAMRFHIFLASVARCVWVRLNLICCSFQILNFPMRHYVERVTRYLWVTTHDQIMLAHTVRLCQGTCGHKYYSAHKIATVTTQFNF